MSAYIIFNYRILDEDKINDIKKMLVPLLEKYETKVIVASPISTVEGSTYPNLVIHKFNNLEDAKHFYYSKEHQAITTFRQGITKGWATIVPEYMAEIPSHE